MKHIYKLWSILLLWAVFPLNGEAWALPVVSGESRLEAGASYYLYNAGTRSFLEHGGAWSTQATGGREGLLLKFVAVEGGLPDEYYLYDESKKRYLFATSKDSRVEDGKGVFVDGRSPFAWTVVPDGGAFRIQVSLSEEELHDAALFLGRREDRKKYPGGFYYDTPLGGSPDDIRWLLVSEEAYASYQAEASRYSEARRLADKIKEARLKGIPDGAVAEAEAVYTDTGSTEEQLTAAITALYGAGLKVFVHPGILVTRETIKRMRASIENREYPAYDGYCLLRSSTHVGEDYEMYGPYPYISRDHPDYKYTSKGMSTDFGAAYENALMWALTEEEAYAHKSMEILVAYADTLLGIPESGDRALLAGGEGFKILRALELLKHTWPGVSEEDISKVERMVKEFFIPVMEQFYDTPACTNGNWGFIVTMGYMAAAIYFDDTRMYDRACGFYLDRKDNGTIRNYVDAETGQLQESGRDQQHSMLAISAMSMICEMAHRQGDSLYALLDNRLMKGVEYVARYNMGHDVPFRTWDDVTGKYCNWTQVSPEGRGRIRGVFECAYNHYVNRLGLEMPYTAELLAANRPEGLCNESDCGSLLYYEGGAFPRDPWLGRLDIDFARDPSQAAQWWIDTSGGAAVSWDDGKMRVDMAPQSNGKWRGDIQWQHRVLADGRSCPILAVKMQGVESINVAFDTDRGPYGKDGYGKWEKTGDDVYFCDLRALPFGNGDQLGNDDLWEFSKFAFKVAGLDSPYYTVEWVKTFRSSEELRDYVTSVDASSADSEDYRVVEDKLYVRADGEVCLYAPDGRRLVAGSAKGDGWVRLTLPRRGVYVLSYPRGGTRRMAKVCRP